MTSFKNELQNDQEKEILLSKAKPILKKNTYHLNNNVILTFKSIEIYFIDEDKGKQKVLTPIYVPPNCLNKFINLSKSSLELEIMENIMYDNNSNSFNY